MNTTRRQRIQTLCGVALITLGVAIFVLIGFRDQLYFFKTPKELSSLTPNEKNIRLGGYVVKGSVHYDDGTFHFKVTDYDKEANVVYKGVMPELFREGQNIIAEGHYDAATHTLMAERILAKHDEKYVPKDIAQRIKKRS